MKQTVRSIIANVHDYHSGLGRYYLKLKERATDARCGFLLDYLARHEDYVARHLENYLVDAHDRVLDLWVPVVPKLSRDILGDCQEAFNIPDVLGTDDIIAIAIRYDECLVNYLTVLHREVAESEAKDMFSNLLNWAVNEEKKLARNASMFQDI